MLFLAVAIPLVYVAYRGLPFPSPALGRALLVAALLLAMTVYLSRRQGRPLAGLGLSTASAPFTRLGLGLAGGVLLFLLAALVLRGLLPFHWEFNRDAVPAAMVMALLYHLATNFCEELAFRGYAFAGLIRLIGHWPAQAVIAGLFAAFHVCCGWPWHVALFSTTAGSLLFGLIFVRWHSLPMATGTHAAWNWTRDLVLGAPGDVALLSPVGMEAWTSAQWHAVQAVMVAATVAACAAICYGGRKDACAGRR